MKYLLICCAFLLQVISYGQNRKQPVVSLAPGVDTFIAHTTGLDFHDYFVYLYADSINAYPRTHRFPSFLQESQFDYRYSVAATGTFHVVVQLRREIVGKINDCNTLRQIMYDPVARTRLRAKAKKEDDFDYPDVGVSFYDLLQHRSTQLDCR